MPRVTVQYFPVLTLYGRFTSVRLSVVSVESHCPSVRSRAYRKCANGELLSIEQLHALLWEAEREFSTYSLGWSVQNSSGGYRLCVADDTSQTVEQVPTAEPALFLETILAHWQSASYRDTVRFYNWMSFIGKSISRSSPWTACLPCTAKIKQGILQATFSS